MGKSFPQVQPGGSLILAWRIKDKNVLVVGGGEVSLFAFQNSDVWMATRALWVLGDWQKSCRTDERINQ